MSEQGTKKTEEQWREKLTHEQYHVTREKGTEPAFSGAYWKTKTPGTYVCVCCGEPLFQSDAKFDSGTGWPSFTAPVDDAEGGSGDRHKLRNDAHRGDVPEVRGPSWPRLSGWPCTHRHALLHQFSVVAAGRR